MKTGDQDSLLRNLEKINRLRAKRNETSVRNFSSVPPKATIRLEYIRCGKRNCKKCFQVYNHNYTKPYLYHGPYFCAYWRDKKNQGKLRKKYIGKWNEVLGLRLNSNGRRIGQWDPRLILRKLSWAHPCQLDDINSKITDTNYKAPRTEGVSLGNILCNRTLNP